MALSRAELAAFVPESAPTQAEYKHVPTCEELAARGLARQVPTPRGVAYVISEEGQALIYDAMKHNGRLPQPPTKLWRNKP